MCVELIAITPDAEAVIEQAGRTCYQSASRAGRDSKRNFIRRIVENGHYSVLEHAYATFKITEASGSFTHQLVRQAFIDSLWASAPICGIGHLWCFLFCSAFQRFCYSKLF